MLEPGIHRDRQIQQNIMREFEYDPHIGDVEIGIQVHTGQVTLSGMVETYALKIAAQEAAHRCQGVLDVANDIVVSVRHEHPVTDPEIAEAVRRALEWDELVQSDHIHTTVTDGWVVLHGDVPSLLDKTFAEYAVHTIKGVRGVANSLEVVSLPIAREDVKRNIVSALERQADLHAGNIFVEVRDGIVVLSGCVSDWQERREVLHAASRARGVHRVEDRLRIDPNAP